MIRAAEAKPAEEPKAEEEGGGEKEEEGNATGG